MEVIRKPIPAWVRSAVLLRARHRCEECGDSPVELHHLTYSARPARPDKDYPIFGEETPDDLLALCRECHHAKHIGPAERFYADPEECQAEWEYYHHRGARD